MKRFEFKTAKLSRLIAAAICFGLIFYVMLKFGFKQTHGTVAKSLLAGALFSFGMWFISSLLSKQGKLNNRLMREHSNTHQDY